MDVVSVVNIITLIFALAFWTYGWFKDDVKFLILGSLNFILLSIATH